MRKFPVLTVRAFRACGATTELGNLRVSVAGGARVSQSSGRERLALRRRKAAMHSGSTTFANG